MLVLRSEENQQGAKGTGRPGSKVRGQGRARGGGGQQNTEVQRGHPGWQRAGEETQSGAPVCRCFY